MPQVRKWRTKDGRTLALQEMETDHIKNAMAMLTRNGYVSVSNFWGAVSCASSCGGEMAQMYAEQEIAGTKPTGMLDAMEEELARRNQYEPI